MPKQLLNIRKMYFPEKHSSIEITNYQISFVWKTSIAKNNPDAVHAFASAVMSTPGAFKRRFVFAGLTEDLCRLGCLIFKPRVLAQNSKSKLMKITAQLILHFMPKETYFRIEKSTLLLNKTKICGIKKEQNAGFKTSSRASRFAADKRKF